MTGLLAIVTGALYAAGFYMITRRSIVKLVIGLAFLAHGSNLLIFTAGGISRWHPPLLPTGSTPPPSQLFSDPLPQAVILTAIVISFGLQAFLLALVLHSYKTMKTDDLDRMTAVDKF